MAEQKVIFLDIDGTLTPAGSNTPPESALRAIRAAQAKGHKVFLCTGRNMGMLAPLLPYGFDGVVASAGGYVTYGDKVLFDCPMTQQQTALAMELLKKNGVFRTLETKNATYGDSGLAELLDADAAGNSEIERWRKALAEDLGIRPMEQYDGAPAYKIVIMCRSEEQLTEPRRYLEQDFDFCMQTVAAHSCLNGELINRAFDKGTGVHAVCKALGLDPMRDAIGFGDSMNDMGMVKAVGLSYGMANGSEALKAACTRICPAVDQDGLAAAFAECGLS